MGVEVIDLTGFRDRTGSRVPEGDYLVTVEDIEVGTNRKDNPMWTVYLRVVGGEFDGSTLIDRISIQENTLFRLAGFLQGMGVKVERKKMKVDTARLIGKRAKVTVTDGEPFQGVTRSEVRSYERFVTKPANATDDDIDDVNDAVLDEEVTPDLPDTVDDAELDIDDIDV